MKSRVGERPYLFEQVMQVINEGGGGWGTTKHALRDAETRSPGITFVCILPADQREGSRGADLQEQAAQRRFGRALCGGKGGGGPSGGILRMQTRRIFIAGMRREFLVASYPRCNAPAAGKRMNSAAAAGAAKDSVWSAHVALHNFPEFCRAVSAAEKERAPVPSQRSS